MTSATPASLDFTPFEISVADDELMELRRRLHATRFPEPAPGEAWQYGTDLGWLREAVRYWADDFDWAAHEALLNRWPQFRVTVDGEQVHLLHVRSAHDDALPLVITHGWPGSVAEFVDIIDPLVDPTAHGGDERDAFHLVIPSMPGYGWSGPTASTGVGPRRVAEMWAQIMAALGYDRYGAQGGDWGSMVTTELARVDPDHVAGIHLNMPGGRPTAEEMESLTPVEQEALADAKHFQDEGSGYFRQQSTKPQTVGYGLDDSPAGLLAWIGEKFRAWTDNDDGPPEAAIGMDALLRNVSIYWFTATAHSSARMYYEYVHGPRDTSFVDVPTGAAVFPKEINRPSEAWAARLYDLRHFVRYGRGGHFAAMEVPDLLVGDIRAFFRLVR